MQIPVLQMEKKLQQFISKPIDLMAHATKKKKITPAYTINKWNNAIFPNFNFQCQKKNRKHLSVFLKICVKSVLFFVFLPSLETNVNICILPHAIVIYIEKNVCLSVLFQTIHHSCINFNEFVF